MLHNRWFSANNNSYIKDHGFAVSGVGGAWNRSDNVELHGSQDSFIVESDIDVALPVRADVFTYLMSRAKAWGMVTYEQDWLIKVWQIMNVTKANVTAGADWLKAMSDAAQVRCAASGGG